MHRRKRGQIWQLVTVASSSLLSSKGLGSCRSMLMLSSASCLHSGSPHGALVKQANTMCHETACNVKEGHVWVSCQPWPDISIQAGIAQS